MLYHVLYTVSAICGIGKDGLARPGRTGGSSMYTSRDRVLCALNHEEPDRVPVFFVTSGVTSMLTPAYERLKSYGESQAMLDGRHALGKQGPGR